MAPEAMKDRAIKINLIINNFFERNTREYIASAAEQKTSSSNVEK